VEKGGSVRFTPKNVNKATLQRAFGNLIRRRREVATLTQEALAGAAGIHRTYISLLERGARAPTIEVVRRLAKALKTSMTSLIAELEGVDVAESR
jgi:transcriptional regulator with XRE-family HTH domain